MNNKNSDKEYYLGLDIGTDSVGYAVTNPRFNVLKFRGEAMWGSHLFDPAKQAAERRGFRTARRRLDRKQQRIRLTDEIFIPEVIKIDPHFYIRKKESALFPEDSSYADELSLFFNDSEYKDSDYYDEYPTIHHLICALIENKTKKFDIRLINIAIDWLVSHRGHFLNEVNKENVDKVLDFKTIYDSFMDCFDNNDEFRCAPWDSIEADKLGDILKKRGVNNKKALLKELLYDNKNPEEKDGYFLDRKELITFLAGGKVQCNKLFKDSSYEDDLKISISDDMEAVLPQLGDDADIIAHMAAMHDWSVLSDILDGEKYISKAKVKVFEQHKEDLKRLKSFVRKYVPEKYNDIFRKTGKEI
ncbi:MAG: hypothetical protein IJM14_07825, partial [Lachnospiraceae bacterium]|nr:hypothetical protein [Lachnospiraceae bacterium]